MEADSIIIDPEFSSLVPPLSAGEASVLEASLKAEGCREALIASAINNILLDGHNRYEICRRNNIPFEIKTIDLPDREAAIDWIYRNQLGRRNLQPHQFTLLLGNRYLLQKKQGERTDLTSDQNAQKSEASGTAERLAQEHGISAATVRRAGQFAAAVHKLKSFDADIEQKVNAGKAPTKGAVMLAAELMETHPEDATALLSGELTATGLNTKEPPEADDWDSIAARAADAVEKVVDIGDGLFSVRGEIFQHLVSVCCVIARHGRGFYREQGKAVLDRATAEMQRIQRRDYREPPISASLDLLDDAEG
jgi:hypothetical protein